MNASQTMLGLLAFASLIAPAGAQQGGHGTAQTMQLAQAAAPWSEGEVRRIDKEGKRITLKHGAIPNLEMSPMTMSFRVQDAALLERVSAGDKVRFAAEKVDGQITVTRIERTEQK